VIGSVALLVGLSTSAAIYSALAMIFAEDRVVKRRLKRMTEYERSEAVAVEPLLAPFASRVLKPALAGVARAGRLLSPVRYRRSIAHRLTLAGEPRGMSVDRLLTVKMLIVLGMSLGTGLVALVSPLGLGRVLLLGLILVPGGFFLPDLWLSSRVESRKDAIRRALPDMLDMLTVSVEAGLGFDAAVARLVSNTQGPLAEEFARMLKEVQGGIPRREAFRHLAARVDVRELNTFIVSMVQAEAFGISIASVLRTQAREMRIRRHQYAEEQAQKAPVKIVFPLVICILPATLIVIVGPAIVSIAQTMGDLMG